MARLEYQITGDLTGLNAAAGQVTGILNNLQAQADKLRIKFFQAEDVQSLNAIGGALTIITSKINDYTNAAVKGSAAFQDQQVKAALDTLSNKITVLTGNAQLFGNTVENNKAQITAYQGAINKLLSAGLDPLDSKVSTLKGNIDNLTAAVNAQKAAAQTIADPYAKFQPTGGLITDLENRLRNLNSSLKGATDTRSIIQYNQRIKELKDQLASLNSKGLSGLQNSITGTGRSAAAAGTGINSFNLELGRIVQDAPFAANNFGAIGNNITRLVEVLPQYGDKLREAIKAQGGTVTSGAVLKQSLASLFTGFSGLSLGISLAVTAFTFYQQYQQKAARDAQDHTSAVEKQKKALDDFVGTLGASARASADAAGSYGEEINKLNLLFSAIQKDTGARYENGTAIDELQKKYPETFAGLKDSEFLAGKAADAFGRLRDSIIATAIAQSAIKLAGKSLDDYVNNTVALNAATQNSTKAEAEYQALLAKRRDLQQREAKGEDPGVQLIAVGALINEQYKRVQDLIGIQKQYASAAGSAAKQVDAFNKTAVEYQNKITTSVKSGIVYDLESQIKKLKDRQPYLKTEAELNQNVAEIKAKQTQLDDLLGKQAKTRVASLERQVTLSQQLQGILEKGNATAAASGLTGYAAEVQRINANYKDLNKQLDDFRDRVNANKNLPQTKKDELLGKVTTGRGILAANQSKELTDAAIAEANRAATEIQRINDEFGVKAAQGRDKELASIQKTYDAEITKAGITQGEIEAIQNGRLTAIQAVNEKYQALSEDLQSKISTIEKTSQAESEGREETATQRIKNEYDRRLKAAQKYYDELRALNTTNDPNDAVSAFNGLILDAQQATTNTAIKKGETGALTAESLKPFTNALDKGVKQFGSSFSSTIANIGEQGNATFGQIFSNLEKDLQRSVISTLAKIGTDYLGQALQKGITSGTSGLADLLKGKISTGVIAGVAAAAAGALISGATPKTSSVGQGLGGALSGAATGAAIGSLVGPAGTLAGAVIGGIGGLIGGLFGASKARKEAAAAAAAQLEESRKQTALLRQQALAYTSSVIGRMTTQGVITGVDVNAFGELTATVSGKDLQFVLDRNAKSR